MLDKIKSKIPQSKESPALKMIIVGMLTLLMMIPMGMIESVITERHYRLSDTQREISNNWGAALLTIRSVKYAILYIVLTFTAFFMFETLGKLRIHPLQYLLIGLSICLFYLNLLSISEHISFNKAYVIATMGTVGLVFGYSIAVLRSRPKATIILPEF